MAYFSNTYPLMTKLDSLAEAQVKAGREIGEALYLRLPRCNFTECMERRLEQEATQVCRTRLQERGLEADRLARLVRFYSRLCAGTARRRFEALQAARREIKRPSGEASSQRRAALLHGPAA